MAMVRLYQLLNETVYYERIDGFCLYIVDLCHRVKWMDGCTAW